MSVRSNYIKKLMETKNSFDKQYQEVLAESIKSIIGDNTREEVRNLLKEAKDEEEDSFEEETVDDTETLNNVKDLETEEPEEDNEEMLPGYISVEDVDDVENLTKNQHDNVWDEIEDCKGEDGEYDCRGMDNDKLLKVLKAMNPEDGIRVISNDDDKIKVEVDGDLINGKEEFIIDLEDFDDFDDEDEEDVVYDDLKEERGPKSISDEDDFPWDDYELEIDADNEDDKLDQEELHNLEKKSQKKDKYVDFDNWDDIDDFESNLEDDMYESLGYTTEYQKESALDVDNNDEVANPKTTRSVDAGLPKGVERPYGKMVSEITESILEALNDMDFDDDNDDMDDLMFDENGEVEFEKDNERRDNEYIKDYKQKTSKLDKTLDFDNWDDVSDFDESLDEVASTTQNNPAVRGTSMTHANTNLKGKKFRSSSEGGQRVKPTTRNSYDDETVNESLVKELKRIQEENKAIKEFIPNLQQKLDESMVINSSMGFIVKLLNENTTTQEEKRSITERFTKVNTINEGKLLYETISKELKEFGKAKTNNIDNLFNSQLSEGEKQKKNLVETTMYKSNELNETLSFMQRLNAIK